MAFEYYASPKGSDRALAFQKAWANATPGKTFWFEGQPYAGPPADSSQGILAPGQQVQQYPAGVEPHSPVSTPEGDPFLTEKQHMLGPAWEGSRYPGGLLDEEGPGRALDVYKEVEQINPLDQAYIPPELAEQIRLKKLNELRRGIPGEETSYVSRWAPHVTPSGYVDPTRESIRMVPFKGTFDQAPESMMGQEEEYKKRQLYGKQLEASPEYFGNRSGTLDTGEEAHKRTPAGLYGYDQFLRQKGLLSDTPPPIPAQSEGPLVDETGWERNKYFNPNHNPIWAAMFTGGLDLAFDDEGDTWGY